MENSKLEGLTSYLIVDFLEKQGISKDLSERLQNELSSKGLFQSMISIDGPTKKCTFEDLKSQIPTSDKPILKNMIENQYKLTLEQHSIKSQKDKIVKDVQEKYNIFDHKQRRKRLRDPKYRGTRNDPAYNFPVEIFTENWNKFKSLFGHLKRDLDPDDPINGSPVYNLIYDKTGQYVISAADDGLIKIWSTTNGQLVNTLIGHCSDINATALSECGKYLASCSNDGVVRIWKMEDGSPIAVFKDHQGIVCSLNFFSIPQYTPEGKVMRNGLASASDDGTIKIYFEEDFAEGGGMLCHNRHHLTLHSGNLTSKGFSSIEFHPEGFIAAGTNQGYVIIWDKLFNIDTNNIEKHRIIKSEHSKDCHLTLWNKEGNKLITASFDGTAKLWPWICDDFLANKDTKCIYVFDGELGKGSDIKCCAVAWSCRGRYAIASFCKKINTRRGEDNSLIFSNIQVYDTKVNARIHKFDKTFDGSPFENYIFILEPHPFNEAVLLSADYDGKIVLWNIELGVILNCFIENCGHLGYPNFNAPILDGRFSPDGFGFAVASYYGTVSMYGYGDRELFLTTPTEQFYWKEFQEFDIDFGSYRVIAANSEGLDMHLIPKGPLCSSKQQIYKPLFQDQTDYLDFDEHKYLEKYSEALEAKRHSGVPNTSDDYSLQCFQSLKMTLQEKTHEEIQKSLEEFYMQQAREGKLGSISHFVRPEALLEMKKEDKSNLRRLTRGAPATHPTAPPQTSNTMHVELQDFMDESDYNPAGSEDEKEDFVPRRTSRRRTQRRVRIDEDEEYGEASEEIRDHKEVDPEELLFGEEEHNRERRPPERRSTRRLMLDEDEDEKYEEAPRRNEERWTRQRNERSNRAISGRRNRQLVNNTGLSQRTAMSVLAHNNRAARTRIISEENTFEEALCSRCNLENARVKCVGGCGRSYHSGCAKKHGRDSELGVFTCLWCILRKRKGEKVYGNLLNREWCNEDLLIPYTYIPQVGDLVTYIFQAHEDFVSKYFDHLRFQQNELYPFERIPSLKGENVCRITSLKYTFPFNPRRSHKGQFYVLMKLEFEVLEPQEARGQTFGLTYFKSDLSDFIIPRNTYLKSIALAKQQRKENQVTVWHNGEKKLAFLADQAPKEEGPFPDSKWCCLQLFDHSDEGGYSLRKSRREQALIYASPWDIFYDEDIWEVPRDNDLDKDFESRVIAQFDELVKEDEQFEPFIDEVNKKIYTDYLLAVPFEMNVEKIKRRIFNMYYRHKEAIKSDIDLIKINCTKYNQADAPITGWADRLITYMKQIVDGTYDPAKLKAEMADSVKTRSQRRSTLQIQSEEEKKEYPTRSRETREKPKEKYEEPIVEIPLLQDEEEEEGRIRTRSKARRTRNIVADEEEEHVPVYQQPTISTRSRDHSQNNNRPERSNPYSRRLRSTNRSLNLQDPFADDSEEEEEDVLPQTRTRGGTKLKLLRKSATMRARNESLADEYTVEELDEEEKEQKQQKAEDEGYKSKLRRNKRTFTQFFEHVDDGDEGFEQEKNGHESNDDFDGDGDNHSGHETKLDDYEEEPTKIRLINTRSRSRNMNNDENSNSQPFSGMSQNQNLQDEAELAPRRYPSRSTRNRNPMVL